MDLARACVAEPLPSEGEKPSLTLVLMMGLEPMTSSLPRKCTTAVLHQHRCLKCHQYIEDILALVEVLAAA